MAERSSTGVEGAEPTEPQQPKLHSHLSPLLAKEREGAVLSPRRNMMEIKRKEVKADKKALPASTTVTPPPKGTLKAAAAVRKESGGSLAGGQNSGLRGKDIHAVRRADGKDLIHSQSPSSSPASPSGGEVSPARVVGNLLNGLRARKRTDSLPDRPPASPSAQQHGNREERDRSANQSNSHEEDAVNDGSALLPVRKNTPVSFKLTPSQEELSEPPAACESSLTPTRGSGGEGDHNGSGTPSQLATSTTGREAESLRKALSREVQSANALRDKLAQIQKKSEFLERNREELQELLSQLRRALALEESANASGTSSTLSPEANLSGEEPIAAAGAGPDEEEEQLRAEKRGAGSQNSSRSSSSSGGSQEDTNYDPTAVSMISPRETKTRKLSLGSSKDEERGKLNEDGGKRISSEKSKDVVPVKRAIGLIEQALALSGQTWEQTAEARKEKEREDRKQALRQERDKKRADKQRERELREERARNKKDSATEEALVEKEKKDADSPAPRKISLGSVGRRNSMSFINGFSFGMPPIDFNKTKASSLMRIAKGRMFAPGSDNKTNMKRSNTFTLDDIRHLFNDPRKGGRSYVREAGRDASAMSSSGQERNSSPSQFRRFRRASESSYMQPPGALTLTATAAPTPSSAPDSSHPDKGLIDMLLKPASLYHFQLHLEQTKKLRAFITHQTKPKHSEQDLLDLLDEPDDEKGRENTTNAYESAVSNLEEHVSSQHNLTASLDGEETKGKPGTDEEQQMKDAGDDSDKQADQEKDENNSFRSDRGSPSTEHAPEPPADPSPTNSYRQAFSRLLQFERELCQNLELVITRFWRMIFGRGSTAGSHVARLSANVELLWALHRQLLQSLERNGQLPVGDQDIATCFGGILEHLEIYLAFSASFRDLMVVVDSAILNLESSFAQTGYSRSDLVLHLQRPLQHLQAYPFILTEIIRLSGVGHKHNESLPPVISTLSAATRTITTYPTLAPEQISVWALQDTFHWLDPELNLAEGGRVFVRGGYFSKLSSRGEIICRRLLLFNDLIIVARVLQTRQCLLKTIIPLSHCLLLDCGESSNAFEIVHAEADDRAVLTASSKEEKDAWMAQLMHCLLDRGRSSATSSRQ